MGTIQHVAFASLILLSLAGPSCSGSDETNPGSNAQKMLEDFCSASVAACTSVTPAQCQQIVTDAGKGASQTDVECAKVAKTCEDTGNCLDAMKSGSATSQPTGPSPATPAP